MIINSIRAISFRFFVHARNCSSYFAMQGIEEACTAAAVGDFKKIEKLAHAGLNFNDYLTIRFQQGIEYKRTPLAYAVKYLNAPMVTHLIMNHDVDPMQVASIEKYSKDGHTLLNTVSPLGLVAMDEGSSRESQEITQMKRQILDTLFSCGVTITGDRSSTAILLGIDTSLENAKMILNQAVTEICDKKVATPAHSSPIAAAAACLAASIGHISTLKKLSAHGVDLACEATIKRPLEEGEYTETPLGHAIAADNLHVVKYLIGYGIKPGCIVGKIEVHANEVSQVTALGLASHSKCENGTRILKFLLESGAKVATDQSTIPLLQDEFISPEHRKMLADYASLESTQQHDTVDISTQLIGESDSL